MQELESGMINMDALCDDDISASVIHSGLTGSNDIHSIHVHPRVVRNRDYPGVFIHQTITYQ